jgi:site-specific recombinase XerD
MKKNGLKQSTIIRYRNVYNNFVKFYNKNKFNKLNKEVCLKYVFYRTGKKYNTFEVNVLDQRICEILRSVKILLEFQETGIYSRSIRNHRPTFICPCGFSHEYDMFCEDLVFKGYSKFTIYVNNLILHKIISYFDSIGIKSPGKITISHIDSYLDTVKFRSQMNSNIKVLRRFFSFLYDEGYIKINLSQKVPKLRRYRNNRIPHAWSKSDIKKLLNVIDRYDPKGKRNYAIILLAIRLGVRINDIRNLKLSSIDWDKHIIKFKMSKTGQFIELPLLKDVGWAIIDYIKNGRPKTSSECIFVKHCAPFDALGEQESLNRDLHRYMLKANLSLPKDQRNGIHSLRSALAVNMLRKNAPLPVISESLGHQSVDSTSDYIKIDIEGLRRCTLDPDEVFLK